MKMYVVYLGKVKGFTSLCEKTQKNGKNMFCILTIELCTYSYAKPFIHIK